MEALASDLVNVLDRPHHAHHGRGIDRLGIALGIQGFVVERHVAARDRRTQLPAGIGQAATSIGQLPIAHGLFGAAEVQVIGYSQRFRPHARQVAGRLRHHTQGPLVGVEVHMASVAIHRGRHALGEGSAVVCDQLGPQPHHRRIGPAGHNHRVVLHLVIVLAIDPGF